MRTVLKLLSTKLLKLVDECRRYGKPKQCRFRDTVYTISGVRVSAGGAETSVRRGGIANHHSIAYSVSNISAKKSPKSVDVH